MKTKILDHGYIELIEHWGSDERIIEAARMSTDKGFQGWGPKHSNTCPSIPQERNPPHYILDDIRQCDCNYNTPGDEKLLKYLWTHKHATPFEMAGLVIEVKAPIFVFREWHRHRTQSYNEMSARYIPLPDENYVPSVERLKITNDTNKQAGSSKDAAQLTSSSAQSWRYDLEEFYKEAQQEYDRALKMGIPKELARLCLPVGRYSKMRASANLRNWLAFLTLRMDANAQWEIRQYSLALATILRELFPRTMWLFDNAN